MTEPMFAALTGPADVDVILAIDPGTRQSAWIVLNPATMRLRSFAISPNETLLDQLRQGVSADISTAVIEQVASYGMPVGADIFETVRWAGRFEEALHPTPVVMLTRKAIVVHLCQSARAKDPNVRRVLLDRFGGDAATGTKRSPGPLYGIHADLWSALAVAVTYAETRP